MAPGQSMVITARVRNASSIVDRVTLTIHGPSAAWWKVDPPSVSLYPGTEAEVRLEFRPPKGSELLAGPTPVGLRAQTEPPEVRTTTSEFQVVVDPVTVPSSELVPRTSRGRRTGRHTLTLTNGGNAPWPATVRAVDPDARIRLQASPETFEVRAGGRMTVAIVATGGFNFFGPPDVRPFVVEVRPADGGPLITHEGRFEQSALFRALPLALLLGLAASMLVVVAVMAGWIEWPPWKAVAKHVRQPVDAYADRDRHGVTVLTIGEPVGDDHADPGGHAVAPRCRLGPAVGGRAKPRGTERRHDTDGRRHRRLPGLPGRGRLPPARRSVLADHQRDRQEVALPAGGLLPASLRLDVAPSGPVADLGYPTDRQQTADGLEYQLFDNGGLYCSTSAPGLSTRPSSPSGNASLGARPADQGPALDGPVRRRVARSIRGSIPAGAAGRRGLDRLHLRRRCHQLERNPGGLLRLGVYVKSGR